MGKVISALLALGYWFLVPASLEAQEIPAKYRATVAKGLKWLAEEQKGDGSWGEPKFSYGVALTSFAGLALMQEGSTTLAGPYAKNLSRAVAWLEKLSRPDGKHAGLIGDEEASRNLMQHGLALTFLARSFVEEEDGQRRAALKKVLEKGIRLSVANQTTNGGWNYAPGGGDFDEGMATVLQIHGLRAARNAGLYVPRASVQKALDYFRKGTTTQGGIVYSVGKIDRPAHGGGRPVFTAGALAALHPTLGFDHEYTRKWMAFCQDDFARRSPPDELLHYFLAPVVYELGEDGWQKAFPKALEKDCLAWSRYRAVLFDHWQEKQLEDGSWRSPRTFISPVLDTALVLTIMQLERNGLRLTGR